MPRSIARLRAVGFAAAIAATFATAASGDVSLDVIYVPTPQVVVDRMMEMAKIRAGDYVIDLGCGDGRMVISAAKLGARGYGVDIDPQRIAEANRNAREANVSDRVSFKIADLFQEDLSKADVLAIYLLSEINLRLRPRILSDMKPGSRVVSHAFDMGEWEPDMHDVIDSKDIFMWYVPAKVEGRWQFENGTQKFSLDLIQNYQKMSGSARSGEESVQIEKATLAGDRIAFTVRLNGKTHEISGRVDGGTIAGEGGWKGTRQAS